MTGPLHGVSRYVSMCVYICLYTRLFLWRNMTECFPRPFFSNTVATVAFWGLIFTVVICVKKSMLYAQEIFYSSKIINCLSL